MAEEVGRSKSGLSRNQAYGASGNDDGGDMLVFPRSGLWLHVGLSRKQAKGAREDADSGVAEGSGVWAVVPKRLSPCCPGSGDSPAKRTTEKVGDAGPSVIGLPPKRRAKGAVVALMAVLISVMSIELSATVLAWTRAGVVVVGVAADALPESGENCRCAGGSAFGVDAAEVGP